MNLKKIIITFVCISTLYSCADYVAKDDIKKKERQYYSSSGFALIYEDSLYSQKILNKKINKEEIHTMEDIFNHVPDGDDLLYARVDYLRANDGSLLLNELELIEPSMFFRHSDDGHKKFAKAIMQTIN